MELLDQTIGNIASDIPGATHILDRYKLDYCNYGGCSLREAAVKRGVDTAEIVKALERLRELPSTERSWRDASPRELINHILRRFHGRHREQLPELLHLARQVEALESEKTGCPVGLADHIEFMLQDLDTHMSQEEQILFPLLLRGSNTIQPADRMRRDHYQHAELLAKLERLTNDLTPPSDASNTWRLLYAGLTQLREDLMQHIHLENNVLFQKIGMLVSDQG